MPPPPGRTNATAAPRPVATPQRSRMPDAPAGLGFVLDLAAGEEQEKCAVCLERFAPDDQNNRVVRLECSHLLHEKCHLELVQAGDDQCPVCRSPCYYPQSALRVDAASGAVAFARPAPIEVSGGELPETMQLETFLETLITESGGDSVGEGEGEVAGAAPIADFSEEVPGAAEAAPAAPPATPEPNAASAAAAAAEANTPLVVPAMAAPASAAATASPRKAPARSLQQTRLVFGTPRNPPGAAAIKASSYGRGASMHGYLRPSNVPPFPRARGTGGSRSRAEVQSMHRSAPVKKSFPGTEQGKSRCGIEGCYENFYASEVFVTWVYEHGLRRKSDRLLRSLRQPVRAHAGQGEVEG